MHFKAVTILLAMLAMSMSWPGAQAAKCSDHIMALKAGGLSNDDDGINSYDATACSALFSTFDRHVPQLQGLVNDHIAQSFLYSIMASHFDSDFQNRLGFGKYLDSLADSQWNDAIELVKYIGKRGAGLAPDGLSNGPGLRITDLNAGVKSWTEVEALALALDHHHLLANKVHQLHSSVKDAALGDFLEDQFASQHVDRIRQLSGHLTNLVSMVQEPSGADLALYLFDQSLA